MNSQKVGFSFVAISFLGMIMVISIFTSLIKNFSQLTFLAVGFGLLMGPIWGMMISLIEKK